MREQDYVSGKSNAIGRTRHAINLLNNRTIGGARRAADDTKRTESVEVEDGARRLAY